MVTLSGSEEIGNIWFVPFASCKVNVFERNNRKKRVYEVFLYIIFVFQSYSFRVWSTSKQTVAS